MSIPYYQVDAFTSSVFGGNPAGVAFLEKWCDDALLQAVAAENNLSETAFLVPNAEGYDLRWFTPVTEVALCGHATLAAAFVLFEHRGWTRASVRFQTRHSGELVVERQNDLFVLDFPIPSASADSPRKGSEPPGNSHGRNRCGHAGHRMRTPGKAPA